MWTGKKKDIKDIKTIPTQIEPPLIRGLRYNFPNPFLLIWVFVSRSFLFMYPKFMNYIFNVYIVLLCNLICLAHCFKDCTACHCVAVIIIYLTRPLMLNPEGFLPRFLPLQTEEKQWTFVKSTDSGVKWKGHCAEKSERSRPGMAVLRKAAFKVGAWLASGNLDFRLVSSIPADKPGSLGLNCLCKP